jgi:hypothetical protein
VVLAGDRVKRKEHRPPRADDKDAAVAAPEQSPGPKRVKLIDVEPQGRSRTEENTSSSLYFSKTPRMGDFRWWARNRR